MEDMVVSVKSRVDGLGTKSIVICSLCFVPEFCSWDFSVLLLNGVRLLLRH